MVSETKINCTVEFFGTPTEATPNIIEADVEITEGAGVPELIRALRKKVPTLEGQVFVPGEDRLQEAYAFNINGEFFVDAGEGAKIKKWDRVVLILLSAGG